MADPTTNNRGLAIPTRGSDVGTWDVPVNGNMSLLDTIVGGIAGVSVSSGSVTLNAAQAACGTISISGALVGNVTVLFPAVQGWWSVENITTNNNSFVVSLGPVGGTQTICAPPGEIVDIQINGSIAKYRNLGRVGSLLELATPNIPLWITGCSVPPYLNCNGGTFSSGTYPQLADYLGGTTLPDSRGRVRAALNQGTGRLSQVINGDSNLAGGGADTVTLTAANIPSITSSGNNTITVSSGATNVWQGTTGSLAQGGGVSQPAVINPLTSTGTNTINVTSTNTGPTGHGNVQPTYVAGYTLIRAG